MVANFGIGTLARFRGAPPVHELKVAIPMQLRLMMLAVSLCVACGAPRLAAAQADVQALASPRWAVLAAGGTVTDYPANVFSVDAGASPRGTGRRLQTADGRADFMLFQLPNRDHDSPRRYIRRHLALPHATLDYERITDRFFVVSGTQSGRVFYSRCNYPRGASGPMQCIYLLYPRAETHAWDAVVTRISRSLRPAT
jgi:hypothetical protein